jgi:tetratricopeptide (TPR) repeat protein
MKKQLLIIALFISVCSFGQKNEIKAIEKALKSGNYIAAQKATTSAAAIMEGADNKTKAKYYHLKGKSFLGNGNVINVKNIQEAAASFKKSNELSSGKYKSESDKLLGQMVGSIQQKAMADYTSNQYKSAADKFKAIYDINGDLDFLYSAAQTYINAKDYKAALASYLILDEKNYTGEGEELVATDKKTGEVKVYSDKLQRTLDLKAGTHINPKMRTTPSQRPKILKNIADLYVELKDNDNALKAIQKAKTENPNDANMLINEANIYYAKGDTAKFKAGLMKAAELDPTNTNILFNIAVVSAENGDAETAELFYNKVLAINPDDIGSNINMSVMLTEKSNALIKKRRDEDDDAKYDAITDEIQVLRKKTLPYLEKADQLQPNDEGIMTALYNLYGRLKMMDKRAAIGKKLN